jgi:membrane fusion protein (multidrug efflux system)
MNTLDRSNPLVMEPSTPPQNGSGSPQAAPPRPRLGFYALVLVVLIVLAFVAGLVPRWRDRRDLNELTHQLATPTVITVSPKPGAPEALLALPAEVRPLVEAPIYARAGGYVKRWYTDIGASVTNGQLLAEIDSPELNQELAKSRADLALSEAALTLAKSTAARWQELLKTASVSDQDAAEKQADLATKTAAVESARAGVRRLEELQSFERVTAPFDGTITARNLDVGQLIVVGAGRELFHVAQTQTLRVFSRVPQTLSREISAGATAELAFSELPGRTFTARVVRTAGALDPVSRTLLTELEVENARGEIFAGAFAQVRFPSTAGHGKLTLPSNTLLFRAEGAFVGVVGADNKVELRRVKLGREFATAVEIVDGVVATDRVVLNPPDALLTGTQVKVAAPTTKEAR